MMISQLQSIIGDAVLLHDVDGIDTLCEVLDLLLSTLHNASDIQQCIDYLMNEVRILELMKQYVNMYTTQYMKDTVTTDQYIQLFALLYQHIMILCTYQSVDPISVTDKLHVLYPCIKIYFISATQNKDIAVLVQFI